MDFLVEMGRGLAIYGVLATTLMLFTPGRLEEFLINRNAKFGILLAGIVAIILGFVIATIGG